MTYDPADRSHDGQRVDALATLVRVLADAQPSMFGAEPWAHICVARVRGGFSVELVMPSRIDGVVGGTYFSTDALMDPAWDGREPRHYGTAEEAVRALLDNVVYRLHGPRERPAPTPAPVTKRQPLPANVGGDSRF